MRTAPVLIASSVFLLAAAAPAHGQRTTSPSAPSVDAYVEAVPADPGVSQYVEAVPTGTGEIESGSASPSSPSGEGPAVAKTLEAIVESPQFGAPASTPSAGVPPNAAGDPALTTSVGESFRSAIGALGTSSDTRLLGVLLVVLLTTVGAVVVSVRRGPT
jgi:hypothetical protein